MIRIFIVLQDNGQLKLENMVWGASWMRYSDQK